MCELVYSSHRLAHIDSLADNLLSPGAHNEVINSHTSQTNYIMVDDTHDNAAQKPRRLQVAADQSKEKDAQQCSASAAAAAGAGAAASFIQRTHTLPYLLA